MRSRMSRSRLAVRPAIPASLAILGDIFATQSPDLPSLPGQEIFRGDFTDAEGNKGLIFMSDHSMELLNAAREIFIDATFKVVPRQPVASQLFTIHVKYMNTVSIIQNFCY